MPATGEPPVAMRFLPGTLRRLLARALLALAAGWLPAGPATAAPPPIPREFRGVWIASKGNIDWPSKPGLTTAAQQEELRTLLDGARRLHLNAVLLQVRPQGDALYESRIEPWSEYLSGREGVAPSPRWDPLAFAVREAHARGLELHAWINPFRARSDGKRTPLAPDHIARRRPDLVVDYKGQLWMDPGEPEVRAHTVAVARDIVRRYDVDGLHLDDYFYPYPVKDAGGRLLPFPDDRSWQRHGRASGAPDRAAWRRMNVDRVVEELGRAVHAEKPMVRFGISPFGIWRPGHPPSVHGLDAYEHLAADAPKWAREGWVDYLAPQLYWTIAAPRQGFRPLLEWWVEQTPDGRHLWPGLSSARIGSDRPASEIVQQVEIVQRQAGSDGYLFWNATSLRSNKGGVADLLRRGPLAGPAVTPATPWLQGAIPVLAGFDARPRKGTPAALTVRWQVKDPATVSVFVIQHRIGDRWELTVAGPAETTRTYPGPTPAAVPSEVWVTPVGRTGATGKPAFWRRP